MKKVLMVVLAGLAVGVATSVWADGNVEAGKTKSATCAACHGADGNSVNPEWPKLAGQHPNYIVKQLTNFKEDARVNASMSPMAKPLSEQDMADLAAYFSSQAKKMGEALCSTQYQTTRYSYKLLISARSFCKVSLASPKSIRVRSAKKRLFSMAA